MTAAADPHHAEVTRIVAVRHGETVWNAEMRMQGQLDTALSERGRWQAARVAEALEGEGIEAIYASDLARAFDTATAIAGRLGLPIAVDTGLRERSFGVFQGFTYAEIDARWPDEAPRWRRHDPEFGPAEGETLREFYGRAVAAATRIAAAEPGRTIALVTHGGVLDCLYRAASRIELGAPRSWELGNAAVNRLLYTPRGFSLVGWSDTSHLEGERPLDDESEGDGPVASPPPLVRS
ncbi:MAG TPA: histidine phosphatase family protein [Caldimonas sp.]|jgi:probable phosphoglycerate mutase|nr:histidine phosphatase family protein [Caldimonas sp.]HEX2540426.1 histidine phosphatase family protein [Caldimonas sp.]